MLKERHELKELINTCVLLGKLRKLSGYSIEEAADYSGRSVKDFIEIEAGENLNIDNAFIIDLCDLYGVDVHKLVA